MKWTKFCPEWGPVAPSSPVNPLMKTDVLTPYIPTAAIVAKESVNPKALGCYVSFPYYRPQGNVIFTARNEVGAR